MKNKMYEIKIEWRNNADNSSFCTGTATTKDGAILDTESVSIPYTTAIEAARKYDNFKEMVEDSIKAVLKIRLKHLKGI